MKLIKFAPFAVAGLLLTACAPDSGLKETLGTLGGAALGGLAGAQIGSGSGQLAATAAGVLIGAVVGRKIGSSLDKTDQLYAERTAQSTLENSPSGVFSQWSNPDSGNYGTVTAQPAYQTASGQYCREYQTTVIVGGEAQEGYGTACRMKDGSWQIQS
jgi:surface antigen